MWKGTDPIFLLNLGICAFFIFSEVVRN